MQKQRKLSTDYVMRLESEHEHSAANLLGAYYDDTAEAVVCLATIAESLGLRPMTYPSRSSENALIREIEATDIHETLHHTLLGEKWDVQCCRRIARWAESEEEALIERLVALSMARLHEAQGLLRMLSTSRRAGERPVRA